MLVLQPRTHTPKWHPAPCEEDEFPWDSEFTSRVSPHSYMGCGNRRCGPATMAHTMSEPQTVYVLDQWGQLVPLDVPAKRLSPARQANPREAMLKLMQEYQRQERQKQQQQQQQQQLLRQRHQQQMRAAASASEHQDTLSHLIHALTSQQQQAAQQQQHHHHHHRQQAQQQLQVQDVMAYLQALHAQQEHRPQAHHMQQQQQRDQAAVEYEHALSELLSALGLQTTAPSHRSQDHPQHKLPARAAAPTLTHRAATNNSQATPQHQDSTDPTKSIDSEQDAWDAILSYLTRATEHKGKIGQHQAQAHATPAESALSKPPKHVAAVKPVPATAPKHAPAKLVVPIQPLHTAAQQHQQQEEDGLVQLVVTPHGIFAMPNQQQVQQQQQQAQPAPAAQQAKHNRSSQSTVPAPAYPRASARPPVAPAAQAKTAQPAPAIATSTAASRLASMNLTKSQAARVIQRYWRGWRLWGQQETLTQLKKQHTLVKAAWSSFEQALAESQGKLTQQQYLLINELAMRVVLSLDACSPHVHELRAIRKRLTQQALRLQDQVTAAYQSAQVQAKASTSAVPEPASTPAPASASKESDVHQQEALQQQHTTLERTVSIGDFLPSGSLSPVDDVSAPVKHLEQQHQAMQQEGIASLPGFLTVQHQQHLQSLVEAAAAATLTDVDHEASSHTAKSAAHATEAVVSDMEDTFQELPSPRASPSPATAHLVAITSTPFTQPQQQQQQQADGFPSQHDVPQDWVVLDLPVSTSTDSHVPVVVTVTSNVNGTTAVSHDDVASVHSKGSTADASQLDEDFASVHSASLADVHARDDADELVSEDGSEASGAASSSASSEHSHAGSVRQRVGMRVRVGSSSPTTRPVLVHKVMREAMRSGLVVRRNRGGSATASDRDVSELSQDGNDASAQ